VGSVAQEDGVRFYVPRSMASCFRPVENQNLMIRSSEMRELPRGELSSGLLPKIIDALFSHHVYNGFWSGAKARGAEARWSSS